MTDDKATPNKQKPQEMQEEQLEEVAGGRMVIAGVNPLDNQEKMYGNTPTASFTVT